MVGLTLLACAWAAGAGAPAAPAAAPPAATTAALPRPARRRRDAAPAARRQMARRRGLRDTPPADFKTLDQEVQGLKKDVIDLNKDLFVLEEELLFPANTQVAVYVSMDVGRIFRPGFGHGENRQQGGQELPLHRPRGGCLAQGRRAANLSWQSESGQARARGVFHRQGAGGRNYRRGATINFDKGVGAKYLELKITDKVPKHQPEFTIKNWE